jgi:hypothetical protein
MRFVHREGVSKDRLAVRAGQSADGGAWFAATDLIRLWPPRFRPFIENLHLEVLQLTPFIEVRTDDVDRHWGGPPCPPPRCCTVDLFTYYGLDQHSLDVSSGPDGDNHLWPDRISDAEFALKVIWGIFPHLEEPAFYPMPDDMPPISHYRFTVGRRELNQTHGPGVPIDRGWTRLAANWGIYAMEVLAASGGSNHETGFGDLKYMGDVDFYEVADYFVHIGEQEWG